MKKPIILSLLISLLLPGTAIADSYTSLWKKYDAAVQKDHPQTALKVLSNIAEKAERERAYGHLLKAQMATADQMLALSPDSLQPTVERMQQCEKAAEGSGDKVLAAVYESVLGAVYTNNSSLLEGGEELGKDYYRKSMRYPDALAAAFSSNYEPFVVDGVDSKYYYDDMLHIIGMRAGDYRTMHDYYASHGKREGACLTALQLARDERRANDVGYVRKSKYIMSLDSLAREYGDLVVAGEVAIERYSYMENADDVTADDKMNFINYSLVKWGAWPRMNILRNAQRRLTLPSFHASLGGGLALPGVTRKVKVMALNNIGEISVTATRLDLDGTTELNPADSKDYAELRRHIIAGEQPVSDSRRYVGLPAFRTVNDTLELNGLRSGVYLVEFSTDNVSVPVERRLLHVCNVYPVVQALPGKRYRIVALDATLGTPVAGAKVDVVMSVDKDGKDVVQTFTCDNNGETYVDYKGNEPVAYRVYADGETAFPRTPFTSRFSYYGQKADVKLATIYTDRSIYRPGQTVHAAAIAYHYDNKEYKGEVAQRQQMTITLRDANRKEVASKTVTTDDYGMASADFVLPDGGLTGVYTLRSDYGNSAYANFSVEEYKRPTFRVDFDKCDTKYAAGDTVRLKASARTFADVPVQGARVAVEVKRRPAMFWLGGGADMRVETVLSDTVQTASDGSFSVAVPIKLPETFEEHPRRYYNFVVTADVTDVAGETRHGETSLPYGDQPTIFSCDVPQTALRDSLSAITFSYRNTAGEPIDGDVTYSIDSHSFTCKANKPVKLDPSLLTSARHSLVAVCGGDTIRNSFVTFTLNDRHVPVETHDWFYQSADRFPADGKPVYIQLGSSDSIQHVVYTLVSGNRVIENSRADLNAEVRTRAITYKEEWGDGVVLSVAWVKSGHSYRHTARIERPLPDTRLNLKWTTFRDRLVPGQRETWTLNITRPDGKPARAQLLATLYDRSLDDIRRHTINFRLPVYVNVPWLGWTGVYNPDVFAYSEMPVRFLDERDIDFSYFDMRGIDSDKWIYMPSIANQGMMRVRGGYLNAVELSRLDESEVMAATKNPDASDRDGSRRYKDAAPTFAMDGASSTATGNGNNVSAANNTLTLRENLNETAFFYPGLTADEKGNVSMKFTLPESVTTWQLYALAHDQQLNNGTIAATAVAKKTVMVQPNVPRFLRSADRGVISARIANTSEKRADGTARLSLINPQTGKEVYAKECKFSVKAGETTSANFDFDMAKIANDGLLICRVTAQGRNFSDGEQHYLPVLPDKEMVVNTMAFSQNAPGTLDVDISKLFPAKSSAGKLTVEYTNSPAWLMVQALPSMTNADGDNAVSLASAYYANVLGQHIMHSVPAIKQVVELWRNEKPAADGSSSLQSALQKNMELKQIVLAETPWLLDADKETEQKQMLANYFDESLMDYRLADNIKRLASLQREDGSFAWWKGMDGSSEMTMSVLQTLVRLNAIAGRQQASEGIIASAFEYMDKAMAREVKDLKRLQDEGKVKILRPSETAVQYLYATTLASRKMSKAAKDNFDYLVALLAKQQTEFSIYGKAVSAVVLAKNGHGKEASDLLESLRQYTVYKEEMGRYFDTPKALYSWFDYRIPSQVAAIEALKTLRPDDTQTIGEMKRWLLQSKRTQAWDTPINSVNAVYAFLGADSNALSLGEAPSVMRVDGKSLSLPKATAALGYVKTTLPGNSFRTLSVEKTSEDTSWGAVYAQFVQPTADVDNASTGLAVERIVMKNGKRVADGTVSLKVGDRVTVRLVVNADRDYDFVQLSDRRAACMEPAQQLSGYGYGYYCQPKDNMTNYFFDRLSKGRHVVETIYYVDREGSYQTGTCFVQCAYSPEFSARAKTVELNVAK